MSHQPFSAWQTWQKVTTVLSGLTITGVFVWGCILGVADITHAVHAFVFDEVEAGELTVRLQKTAMAESYAREKGDLNTQVKINALELRFLENEADQRMLSVSEANRMKLLMLKESELVKRILMINCLQDPSRDPATC